MEKDKIQFKVSNLGPLADAAISLKPLTIFIGPNNAGKSYLAIFVYALLNALESRARIPRRTLRRRFRFDYYTDRSFLRLQRRYISNKWTEDFFNEIREKKKTVKKGEIVFKIGELSEVLRKPFTEIIREFFKTWKTLLKEEMERCYGCEISKLARISPEKNFLKFSILHPFYSLDFLQKNNNLLLKKIKEELVNFEFHLPSYIYTEKPTARAKKEFFYIARDEIGTILTSQIFHELLRGTFYLPAARSGIIQTHKQLSSVVVKRASRVGIERIDVPPFSGTIGDFLSSLLDISSFFELERRRKEGIFLKEVEFLEKEILKGSIEVRPTEKILYPEIYYYQEKGGKFPLHRTSSMVSELAPLSLYLKYFVDQESLLIIEEPESHLHPDAQLIMAKLLSRLVRKNLRLLITTHSDYLLDKINHMIRLSGLSKDERKARGFKENEYLKPEEVGAYLLNLDSKKGGFVTEELKITPEDGIIEEEFLKVMELLNKESALLRRALNKKTGLI